MLLRPLRHARPFAALALAFAPQAASIANSGPPPLPPPPPPTPPTEKQQPQPLLHRTRMIKRPTTAARRRDDETTRISKTAHALLCSSFVTREDGYISVNDLLQHPSLRGVDFFMLERIARTDQKRRYHLIFRSHPDNKSILLSRAETWWIRAVRGEHDLQAVPMRRVVSASQLRDPLVYSVTEEEWNTTISKTGIPHSPKGYIRFAQGLPSIDIDALPTPTRTHPTLHTQIYITPSPEALRARGTPLYLTPSLVSFSTPLPLPQRRYDVLALPPPLSPMLPLPIPPSDFASARRITVKVREMSVEDIVVPRSRDIPPHSVAPASSVSPYSSPSTLPCAQSQHTSFLARRLKHRLKADQVRLKTRADRRREQEQRTREMEEMVMQAFAPVARKEEKWEKGKREVGGKEENAGMGEEKKREGEEKKREGKERKGKGKKTEGEGAEP